MLGKNGDKRRSLLSIDGALDALRPREMWKGVKGTLGPSGPQGGEESRKRGEWTHSSLRVLPKQGDDADWGYSG